MMATDLADVLDEVELMAREQHPPARPGLLGEDRREVVDADRVEAGEGFVEDEELRVVDQRRGELDPLLVAE